jgi:cation:H+ antiporter
MWEPGLTWSVVVFVIAAAVIAGTASLLAATADRLADKTGLGEAVFGAVFLAVITSLPDFAATMKAALDARPVLAVSNIMGSMAANLAILGLADFAYRRANLEHVAASAANLLQSGLLVALIAMLLMAITGPAVTVAGIHPVSVAMIIGYVYGMHLVHEAQGQPMWRPRTGTVLSGAPEPGRQRAYSLTRLWTTLGILAAVTAVAGWVLMDSAESIALYTGISETTVGGLMTALATSSPELFTTIAAVRQGALVMAVGGIVGTNCVNTLAVALADVLYRGDSIYHAVTDAQVFLGGLTLLMTGILLVGLLRRERHGIANIGMESALTLALYAGAVVLLIGMG